ncbi:Cystathionine gamma-synthase [Cladobotryum mycophilum]|uniref:Cystathionine gamma-synthase n=1 Tax=Cladobotryum mycophilum TaxID=491253 RepID=A0ABR0SVL1_9HYPO
MASFTLGESIPPDTAHAVSVSLPTWQSNIGYEEGQEWVVGRMVTGYPRFFIHKSVKALAQDIAAAFDQGQQALLFPTAAAAKRCLDFLRQHESPGISNRCSVVNLALDTSKDISPLLKRLSPTISGVIFPLEAFSTAKQYWQHTGDGVSSRCAEFCHELFNQGLLILATGQQPTVTTSSKPLRGPKRYQRPGSISSSGADSSSIKAPVSVEISEESRESLNFLEERYGRNLDLSLVERAKSAIRRRIAGSLVQDADLDSGPPSTQQIASPNSRGVESLSEGDVYLFPAGMNAIFHTHRTLLAALGSRESINFGFPYVDTLKILQKFGPGCVFYGHGSAADLNNLEHLLKGGRKFLALFCEFPGNPLLACPDLGRIRKLADQYGFAVVVDETIGTFANVNVLQHADVVASSLTKIFSGDSNVMGGCAVLNPEGRYYNLLKRAMEDEIYENAYWPEDIVFMERNSRDFSMRVKRINTNAEAICEILRDHPLVKSLYYPKYNSSKSHYDACRLPNGGYGGLVSIVFHHKQHAQVFYDALETAKGPSLGTNFTLCSPYVLLAHYQELPWAAQFGVDADLIRISVGLEETNQLERTFLEALEAAQTTQIG